MIDSELRKEKNILKDSPFLHVLKKMSVVSK